MGRPAGVPNKDKPFRDALRMEAKLAEDGEETPAKPGSLRYIARQLLIRAAEETTATREVADRLDGKVPQAITGPDDGPIQMQHDLTRLSDSELTALDGLVTKAADAGSDPGGTEPQGA